MSRALLLLGMLGYFCSVAACATPPATPAVTYYINAASGSDTNDGLSPKTPFISIQAAADRVNPGDTVILAPGVYYQSPVIRRFGTRERPITFKADAVAKNRVVITGADPAIREHKVQWVLEDKALGLYSIPCDLPNAAAMVQSVPARVLYSGADLYPYANVDLLKKFTVMVALSKSQQKEVPGPRHGYTWSAETKRLYVRLHASGRYGSTNPNEHVMSVAPVPDGVNYAMTNPTGECLSNIRILGDGWPAHIILDGLTFETPSLSGVFTSASDVTVRNSWFLGCRLGVSGTGGDLNYYRGDANRVVVHNCDYTQWPAYEDGVELLSVPENDQRRFWHRKHVNDGLPAKRFIYETGIIGWAGKDWDVHHNLIANVFEAFSSKATTISENLRIHDNVIEKLLDNAVELENNSQQMHIYRNIIRDTFSPISWQPNGDTKPMPGAAYVYQNVIYNTPEHMKAFGFRHPSVFKIMGPGFAPIAAPGLLFFNNTIFWPDAQLMGPSAMGNHPDRIAFYNNIFAVDFCFNMNGTEWEPVEGFEMVNNLTGATDPRVFAHRVMAGKGGIPLDNYAQIGFTNATQFNFSVTAASPAVGKAVPVPGTNLKLKDIGAVQQGDTWYPLQVGPAVMPAK